MNFVKNGLTFAIFYFLLAFWGEALPQICLVFVNSFRFHKNVFFENLLLTRSKTKQYPIHKFCREDWGNVVLRTLEKQTYFSYLNINLDVQIYTWIHENPEHNLLKFYSSNIYIQIKEIHWTKHNWDCHMSYAYFILCLS